MKKKFVVILTWVIILIFPYFGSFPMSETKEEDKYGNTSKPILSDVIVENYTVPGVSAAIPSSQLVKIGVLGDMDDITGNHSWKGAMVAAREINEAGGLLLNGSTYYIGIIAENTDEANPMLNPATGVSAALKMVNDHEPHFVLGGFRYESLVAYQEVIMDAKIPFICTGCSVEALCLNVKNFYPRYKYFFRIMPINTTALAFELASYISELTDYLSTHYEGNVTKVVIVREDLTWAPPSFWYILNASLSTDIILSESILPIDLNPLAIEGLLSNYDSMGAQILVPLISGHLGTYLGQYYGEVKPRFLLAGLNFRAQSDIYWDDTAGGAQYEIVMQFTDNTSKTHLTIPFWNNFFEQYREEPYYTAVGSYDAVKLLANATVETQTFNSDSIVSNLESKDIINPFIGASGKIAFSNSHDIIEGWPYGTSLFSQWQMDANKVVLSSWNSIYPDSITTGTLSIPYWGINDLVEDNSHKLPGNFTLTSDADEIDTDGALNLIWTPSEGAESYSIYYSKDPITYISKRYTTLVNNEVHSPYPISNLDSGEYFFAVVAYNQSGQTFSNSIHITVEIPTQKPFDPTILIVIGSSIGAASVLTITIIILRKRSIKK